MYPGNMGRGDNEAVTTQQQQSPFTDWTKIKWFQCYTCESWVLKEDCAWIWKIKASKPGGRPGGHMCNKCLGVDVWLRK